jgi:hypothetical protein
VTQVFTSTLHALVGLVSALLRLGGPWAVVVLVVAAMWLVCSRIVRFLKAESRRRPLFTAWLLWHWSRRRR